MNIFNKLNDNLQNIILHKVFKSNNCKNLINDLNKHINRWNDMLLQFNMKDRFIYFTEYLFRFDTFSYPAICNHCNCRTLPSGFYEYGNLYPQSLILNKKKNNIDYYAQLINYTCYGCYFGYSKQPSKFYISIN